MEVATEFSNNLVKALGNDIVFDHIEGNSRAFLGTFLGVMKVL